MDEANEDSRPINRISNFVTSGNGVSAQNKGGAVSAKMVKGVPECATVPLIPHVSSDDSKPFLDKNSLFRGFVFDKDGYLAFSPAALPRMRTPQEFIGARSAKDVLGISKIRVRIDYAGIVESGSVVFQLRYFDLNGVTCAIEVPALACAGIQKFVFDVDVLTFGELFEATLMVSPSGGAVVLVRSVRLEVYGA